MSYLNHNLPTFTCYLRNEYLYNHEKGHGEHTLCDVHAVASIEKRTPLFEAFLENGVNWTRRPLTAFCWKTDAPVLPLEEQLYWDCFSPYIDVQVRARLVGLRADLLSPTKVVRIGRYMFTLDWAWENKAVLDTNFSETPEHKCAHLFAGEDGNYYAYPNNRVIWHDDAWTRNRIAKNPGYKIDMTTYSVENKRKMETSEHYIYDIKESYILSKQTCDSPDRQDVIKGIIDRLPEAPLRQAYREVRLGSDGTVGFQAYAESVAGLLLALGSQK